MRVTFWQSVLAALGGIVLAAVLGIGIVAFAQGYGNDGAGLGVVTSGVDGKDIAPSSVASTGPISGTTLHATGAASLDAGATIGDNLNAGTNQIFGTVTTSAPSGTTQTIDWDAGYMQLLDLEDASGNVTLSFSNLRAAGVYTLVIRQDGGGSNRTVTFPSSILFPGGTAPYTLTVTATADALDVVTHACIDATHCLGTVSQDHK